MRGDGEGRNPRGRSAELDTTSLRSEAAAVTASRTQPRRMAGDTDGL